MAAGYTVSVANNSSGDISVAVATATDTIDTFTNATQTIAAHETRRYIVNATATGYITASNGNAIPAGSLMPYAGATAPGGWLFCYGQAVSRTTYRTLFIAIATAYGVGDGSTTFNLPDLRGRAVFGKDDMGGAAASRITNAISGITGSTLGSAGGDQRMQGHTHTVPSMNISVANGPDQSANNGGATTASGSTGDGNSQNMPPAIILNYIIKT